MLSAVDGIETLSRMTHTNYGDGPADGVGPLEADVLMPYHNDDSLNRHSETEGSYNENGDSGYDGVGPLEADVSMYSQSVDSLSSCSETEGSCNENVDSGYATLVDHVDRTETLLKTTHANQGDIPAGAKHGNILTRCLLKLLRDMNVDPVLDAITAKELIDDLTLRSIREQQITSDKIRKLVRLIDQRNEYVYKKFKDCLHQTGQSDLAKFLEEEEMKTTARRNPSQDQLKESSHKMIQHHYREMKTKLDIDVVMDHLIQDEVLDWNDRDEIMQYQPNRRVERLLQKLLLSKSQLTFECFLSALRQTQQTDLAEKLEMQEECLTDEKKHLDLPMETNYEHWSNIEEYLLEELVPESIMDFFMEMAIFSLEDYTFIFPGTYGRRKRTEEFLKRIKHKLPESFNVLLYALTETDQINIVEELKKITAGTTADGRKHKDKHKRCPDITVVHTDENECTIDGSVQKFQCISLELKITSDEMPANPVENIINIMINDTQKIDSLKINFISSTGCGIVKSEKGSVIIYLQPFSRCSYERLQNFCRSGGLKEFILNILKEEEIIDSLLQGEIRIDVQVVRKQEKSVFEDSDESKGMTSESICHDDHAEIKESLETIKENIIVHFEAIVDEIDPIFFEQLFIDRGILNKQFFMNLKETCKKRKTRAAVFLKEVFVKGGEALIAFIDALKETGCSNLLDMVNSDDKQLHPRQLQSTGPGLFNKEVLRETNVHSKAGLMWSCSLTIKVDKHATSKYISRPDTGVMKTDADAQLYMSTKKDRTDIPMDTTKFFQKISNMETSLEVQIYQPACDSQGDLGAAAARSISPESNTADDENFMTTLRLDSYNPESFDQQKELDQIVSEYKTNRVHDEKMDVLCGDDTDTSESDDDFLYQRPAPPGADSSSSFIDSDDPVYKQQPTAVNKNNVSDMADRKTESCDEWSIQFYFEAFFDRIVDRIDCQHLMAFLPINMLSAAQRKEVFNIKLREGPSAGTKRILEIIKVSEVPGKFRALVIALQTDYPTLAGALMGHPLPYDSIEQNIIKVFSSYITEKMSTIQVLPYLLNSNVVVQLEKEKVEAELRNNGNTKAAHLLQLYLPVHVKNWYTEFLKALCDSGQKELAKFIDASFAEKYISRPDTGVMKTDADAQLYMSTKKDRTDIPMDTTEFFQKISNMETSLEAQIYQPACDSLGDLGAAAARSISPESSAADDENFMTILRLDSYPESFDQQKELDQIVSEYKTNRIHDKKMDVLRRGDTATSESDDDFLYQRPAPPGADSSSSSSDSDDPVYKQQPTVVNTKNTSSNNLDGMIHQRQQAAVNKNNFSDNGYSSKKENIEISLRKYQQELARPAIQGKNVIIVAPTGSGKTRVACRIIQEHLQQMSQKHAIGKVILLVRNVALADQHGKTLQELLRNYRIQAISGDTKRNQGLSLEDSLHRHDILVVTAQLVLNSLMNREIDSITKFSLMIFDECHHCHDEHAYNIIMQHYMDIKLRPGRNVRSLPQIIGLTASVGVGKASDISKAKEHIVKLMANLDTELISTVKENQQELQQYVSTPSSDVGCQSGPETEAEQPDTIIPVPPRANDIFRVSITRVMNTIENIMRTAEE